MPPASKDFTPSAQTCSRILHGLYTLACDGKNKATQINTPQNPRQDSQQQTNDPSPTHARGLYDRLTRIHSGSLLLEHVAFPP